MKTRLFFISVMLLSLLPSMVFSQGAAPGNVNPMVKGVLDVTPLIPSKWGQGCLYNASCPVDTASHATCLHVPSGSGAIA
ncbi:MAG: hypothetical protein NTW16_11820, partial [Bacteroidetes bacterium]|nr:hypothetical protein [Bacteroidota bacterium]